MTIIIVGNSQETYLDVLPATHTTDHPAEDIDDVGTLDVTDANFDTVEVTSGIALRNDAAIAFTPYNSQGQQIPGALYALGRQENIGDATEGLLDGLNFKHNLDNEDQNINVQLHPSQPSIDIEGTKQAGVDWFRITDSATDATIFSVHNDGTLETPGWGTGDLPENYLGGLAVEPSSIYIGASKLSESAGKLHVSHLKSPPHIPTVLQAAPYSFTSGNINANTPRSINDWMILARSVVTAVAAKQIRLKDIFPPANNAADWDDSGFLYTHALTEDAQDAISEFRLQNLTNENTVTTNELKTNRIGGKAGSRVRIIRVKYLDAQRGSVWLGNKLHISEEGGRGQLQFRKDVIPQYLLNLGVTVSDVTALGTTVANCSLEQWEALSVANSGSDELNLIFDPTHVSHDFELKTTVNELLVKPQVDDDAAGITINQPAGGHPCIFFEGNTQGNGLIQFGDQSAAKSLIYSSAASGDLHIDQLSGDVQFTADNLRLNGNILSEATETVHVDASYSGTSDGSVLFPYTTLTAALTAKLVDGSTTTYAFKLGPGQYTGAVSIDHTSKTQSFSIEGSGMNNTFIQAGASFSVAPTNNVLFFRDFVSIELKNVTVRNGAYGFYPRNVDKVTMQNVTFQYCGSAGNSNRHDQSATQAEQTTYWSSSNTSDGGAVRFRSVNEVCIHDCEVYYCLRGLRLQDCGKSYNNSIVSGCKIYRTSEASLYCAASSYTGTDGCINIHIVGNQIFECFNNSILVIGGNNITVQGNNIVRGANAGIMQWHSLDCRIIGNTLFDCNRLTFNGIGNLGDAYGSIVVDGNTNIGSGTYMSIIQNNTMTKCNQGRANAVYGINVRSGAYPTASNKIVKDSNNSDAAVHFNNPASIPVTETRENGTVLGYLTGVTSAIQTQIDSKNPILSSTQLTTVNKSIGTVASGTSSNIATCDDIRTEIAAAGGGSPVIQATFAHMTSFVQLADDIQVVIWGRTYGGNQDYMNGRFQLPLDPAHGHSFDLYTHNQLDSQGGDVQFKIGNNAQTFHSSNTQESDTWLGSSTLFAVQNTGRRHYKIIYIEEGSAKDWHIRRIHHDISTTDIAQIGTNAVFAKHFLKTNSSYPDSDHTLFYQLPSGRSTYRVVLGDLSDWSGTANTYGIQVKLPVTVPDGARVELYSTIEKNTSLKSLCLWFVHDTTGGTPSARRVIWSENGVTTDAAASAGTSFVATANSAHTKRWHLYYSADGDYWITGIDTS